MNALHRFGSAGFWRLAWLLAALGTLWAASGAAAERKEDLPPELEGIGIFERNGESLPLDLSFTDSEGRAVRLGDFFSQGKPVIVTLVYYNCPMLCNILLDGFVAGLKELEWTPGQEFEIVTVSIDPRDDAEQARIKKAHQIENYGRPSAADGWHFLTGEEDQIKTLADAVGFRYAWNPDRQEFMHAAGIFVATPAGVISQTLLGLAFPGKTLRLALVEATDGEIGNFIDQALLFCFHYDAQAGRYAPAAYNLMRLGGALVALALVVWLLSFWIRDRRRRTRAEGARS